MSSNPVTFEHDGRLFTSFPEGGKEWVRCPLCGEKKNITRHGNPEPFLKHYNSATCKNAQKRARRQSGQIPSLSAGGPSHQTTGFGNPSASTPNPPSASRQVSIIRDDLSSLELSAPVALEGTDPGIPIASSPPLPDISLPEPLDTLSFEVLDGVPPSTPLAPPSGRPCPGMIIVWPEGNSMWETYPLQQHAVRNLGWELIGISNNENSLRIRAEHCTFKAGGLYGNSPCKPCSRIATDRQFRLFVSQATSDAKDHTPHKYLNALQLRDLVKRLTQKLKTARNHAFAALRRNKTSQKRLDDYQRMIVLISKNEIPGVRRIMATGLRRGSSPQTIIKHVEDAINHVYSPRGGFTEREFDLAFLVKSLGGPKLLYALQKSIGLPSLSSLRRHTDIPYLRPSLTVPTADDVNYNLTSFLDPEVTPPTPTTSQQHRVGSVVMLDDIAVESVLRYDSRRNSVSGLCREHVHSNTVNVTVDSMDNIDDIRTRIESEDEERKVCVAGSATVVAIGPLARDDHYAPVPIAISTSDKTETGSQLARWLQTVMSAYINHEWGAKVNGPIWVLASDGDSAFRLAKHTVCMAVQATTQPFGRILRPLSGLNLHMSVDGIVGSCDPKHVIKRFATLLRMDKGVMIFLDTIYPRYILELLQLLPMDHDAAARLLDPADKQNVPKAVALIQTLNKLKSLDDSTLHLNPSQIAHKSSLIFFAEFLGYFVRPFTDVTQSLSAQVQSLSTYVHLAFILQREHGAACLTGALYADSQSIVKSIIFTIARMQLINLSLKFYILFEGTDRLEALFSDVRTQDHARNVDVMQLAQKLSVGHLMRATFQRNPDLDRGHARLKLDGALGVDHVNPRSWKGDVTVGNVDLSLQWKSGRDDAIAVLRKYGYTSYIVDFDTLFADSGIDLLRPRGRYVGVRLESDDILLNSLVNPPTPAAANTTNQDHRDDAEDPLGMDIDDFLPDSGEVPPSAAPTIEKTLVSGGKRYLKHSLVAALSPVHGRKVHTRTLRVQGVALEDLRQSALKQVELTNSPNDGGYMKAGDLACVLVHHGGGVNLAVIEATGFKGEQGVVHSSMSVDVLENSKMKTKVMAQVISLEFMPRFEKVGGQWVDWWSWAHGSYMRVGKNAENTLVTRQHLVLEIPGHIIFPLAPTVISLPDSRDPLRKTVTWALSDQDLATTFDAAWEELCPEDIPAFRRNLLGLPTVDADTGFPYVDQDGKPRLFRNDLPASFPSASEKLPATARIECKICRKVLALPYMRNHVGGHILREARQIVDPDRYARVGTEPCGFCGLDGCYTEMTRAPNKAAEVRSTCTYHYAAMGYSQAAKWTAKQPCTNVPIHCRLCTQEVTIWKYNAVYHLFSEHSDDGISVPRIPAQMMVEMFVSKKEEADQGVPLSNTEQWRDENAIPGSDGLQDLSPEISIHRRGTKRGRSDTAEQQVIEEASARAKRPDVGSIGDVEEEFQEAEYEEDEVM